MKSALLTNPIQIANRLDSLGVSKEDLIEVVGAMVAARHSCTDNDPPSAPGWKSWCEGTRRLREMLSQKGWDRSEADQISSAYEKSRGIRIAVCNTDDGTGLEDRQPQNRSKKGAATDRAIGLNQLALGTILNESSNVVQLSAQPGGVVYWYLCVFCEGEVVRAELSWPSECENGFFKAFRERIVLTTGDEDGSGVRVRRDSPNDDSGFEINVTRKKA